MSDIKPDVVEVDQPAAVAVKNESSTAEEPEVSVPKSESSPMVVPKKEYLPAGQGVLTLKEPSPEEWRTPKEPSPEEEWSTPPTSPQPAPVKKAKKRGGRKGGKKGKKSQQPAPSPSPLPSTPTDAQATSLSEKPSRKRKRRDTYSFSPSETSLSIPHSTKQLKLADPDTPTQEHGTDVVEGVVTPPFTPPSSADKQPASNRRRQSTFVVSSNNSSVVGTKSLGLASCNTPLTELSPKAGSKRKRNHTYSKDEDSSLLDYGTPGSQDEQPLTKRSRRSTYEVPSHESSLVNSPVVSSRLDEGDIGVASKSSGCGEDQDVKEKLLNLLDKRVEERSKWRGSKPLIFNSQITGFLFVCLFVLPKSPAKYAKLFSQLI